MTYNNYLPPDEDKLTGVYKVSFEIKVESQDDLSLSDVTQALTEGFERGFGNGFVDKVADLSIEKIIKGGKKAAKVLKVGDAVLLKDSLKVRADILSDDGYLFIGAQTDISEVVGKNIELSIEAGSLGYVNKIADGKVEIVNLDRPITSYQEVGIDAINVDLITVNAEQLEKIDAEEVK